MQRRLLYFVPAIATLVATYALLGPGRGRPIIGCRVFVADDAEGRVRSARLEVVEKLGAYEEPRSVGRVTATLDGRSVFEGAVGDDGLVELRFEGTAGARRIEVRSDARELVSGEVASTRFDPRRVGATMPGGTKGPVAIRVELPRGTLSPPFAEDLRVVARTASGAPAIGAAKIEAEGAEPASVTLPLDHEGVATLHLVPIAQTVELTVTVDAGGAPSTWAGELPVSIGSVWLDPRSTRAHLELAVRAPHEEAFVSLHDARGRFGGITIPLRAAPDGFYRGDADITAPAEGPLTAVVATDPEERGLTTIAWPIDPKERTQIPAPLRRALDGLPAAEERERTRVGRVNRITAGFLAAAALLEIALLVLESRRTRRDLATHFAANADLDEEIPEGGVVRPIRVDTTKLVVSRGSTAIVMVAVGLLLLLSAAPLAALNFVGR